MFDNLLQLAADEDKVTLNSMAAKFPTLKEYFELGERLAPVRDRLTALHSDYATDLSKPVKELEDWRKFRNTDWPAWQTEHTRVEEALATATLKISEIEGSRGTDMTPDEVQEIVKATLKTAGIVDKETLTASLEEFATKTIRPTLDGAVNGLTMRFEDVFDEIEEVRDRHQSTFAETVRPRDIFKFMKENKIASAEEAWTKMTSGKLAEKTAATIASEKKAEYEKGVAEGKKEALKAVGQNRGPVDGEGGGKPMGALMRRAQARMPKGEDGKVDSSKIPLGKGIAKAATEEYYQRQAGA